MVWHDHFMLEESLILGLLLRDYSQTGFLQNRVVCLPNFLHLQDFFQTGNCLFQPSVRLAIVWTCRGLLDPQLLGEVVPEGAASVAANFVWESVGIGALGSLVLAQSSWYVPWHLVFYGQHILVIIMHVINGNDLSRFQLYPALWNDGIGFLGLWSWFSLVRSTILVLFYMLFQKKRP